MSCSSRNTSDWLGDYTPWVGTWPHFPITSNPHWESKLRRTVFYRKPRAGFRALPTSFLIFHPLFPFKFFSKTPELQANDNNAHSYQSAKVTQTFKIWPTGYLWSSNYPEFRNQTQTIKKAFQCVPFLQDSAPKYTETRSFRLRCLKYHSKCKYFTKSLKEIFISTETLTHLNSSWKSITVRMLWSIL